MYLEEETHNRDDEHQTANNLLILPPSSKAAPLSVKGFLASRRSMTPTWEGPRSVQHRVESTALVAILDPADYVRILTGQ